MAAKTKEKETVVVKTQEEMYLDAERLLKATECLTRDKEKAEFFKNLADRYKDLGEYEDSKDKYEECLKKHKYYKEQSKIVKEIQPKEEDFNENKSKSNGIIGKVIIGLVIVLVIAAAGGIVYLKTKPGRYQRATFYENKGNYEKSYKMFKNLKNYKDSKERKRDCKYQFALQCWKDEDYEPAIKMFRELVESEYGDSEEKLADLEIEYIKKQKIGTNVIFGNFHWLILENDGDKVLLVKSEPINGLAYNEGDEATTWSECTLREYLNGSFLDGTFSLNMQKKILDTNIKVENNSTYGTKAGKDTVCDDFISEWRQFVMNNPYFNLNHWLKEMGAENQQAQIFVKESDEIMRKLSLKSSQGGYKVMIIWLPEKMNVECSNKLLKLLEEPPVQTVFLLVSEEPDALLQTIQSRTQRFNIHGIDEAEIAQVLQSKYGLQAQDANDIAHRSEGNFLKALETIHLSEENKLFFELFVSLMRLSYQRKIRDMKRWSEGVASMGRERQKNFLTYCQRMIRENFIFNFHRRDLVYMSNEEQNFSTRFAPFVNERNVMGIMNELSEAQQHIEQNVNAKMVFFDFSLKMIVLLVQK